MTVALYFVSVAFFLSVCCCFLFCLLLYHCLSLFSVAVSLALYPTLYSHCCCFCLLLLSLSAFSLSLPVLTVSVSFSLYPSVCRSLSLSVVSLFCLDLALSSLTCLPDLKLRILCLCVLQAPPLYAPLPSAVCGSVAPH